MNELLSTPHGQISPHSLSGVVGTRVRPVPPFRLILLLLAWAASAMALPLKLGRTWTWRVHDPTRDLTTWRTATVVDSSPWGSGTAWRLVVRDSLTGIQDSPIVVSRVDGSQSWLALSDWIPWEPNPPTATDWNAWNSGHLRFFRSVYYPGDTTESSVYQWGTQLADMSFSLTSSMAGAQSLAGGSGTISCSNLGANGLPSECYRGYYKGSWNGSIPAMDWTDSLGFLRGQPLPNCEWVLESQDRQTVHTTLGRLAVPPSATSFAWIEKRLSTSTPVTGQTSDSDLSVRTWTILSIDDSTGWKRIEIAETFSRTGLADSQSTVHIRANPFDGTIVPTYPQTSGWWIAWSDSASAGGFSRKAWRRTWASILMGTTERAFDSIQTAFEPDGTLKSLWHVTDNYNEYPSTRSSHTVLAIQRVDPPSASHRAVTNASRLLLSSLALLHPSLPIRWRDARGHGGQLPAAELAHGRVGTGVLFLESVLPDGTAWRATSPLPLR